MKKTFYQLTVVAGVLLLMAGNVFSAEFPLREKYPDVKPVTLESLNAAYDRTIIIDVRAAEEYDVIHINKAQHIPVTNKSFLTDLEKVRGKEDSVDIAFYCNGHTCAKSYKAAEMAMGEGFKNVYCFDAGIFEWATAHPEKTTLLGKSPVDTSKLISNDALNAKKIGWDEFKAKAAEPNSIVIDSRDPFQRAKDTDLDQNKNVVLNGIRNIPMDRLTGLLQKGELKDKQLLIFDAVGKQVQWLQYHLQEAGYNNYYFLDKGVLSAAEAGAVK
jgi:rhodanese-related sulfurtransferase